MKSLLIYPIIFVSIIQFVTSENEKKEKELFRIITPNNNTYIQFNMIENTNKYNYLFVQIILCHCQNLSSYSYISIENKIGDIIFDVYVTSHSNFILNITDQINNSLIINATSSDMYAQYQYLKEYKNPYLSNRIYKKL